MPKVIKPSNPFTNVCWVSVLTTFLHYTNFGCIDSFLLPNSRNEEMMGDVLFNYSCLWINLNVASGKHPASTDQRSSECLFFHGVIPMLFEVRRIVCVEN